MSEWGTGTPEQESYQDMLLGARAVVVRAGLCDWCEAQDLDHETLMALAHQVLDERDSTRVRQGEARP